MDIPFVGDVPPRFAGVRDLIERHIAEGEDLGLGLAVVEDGETLLDVRAGFRDRKKTEPFGDPLLTIYSCGKAITGALVMRAVARGELDYDRPVAATWPAFGDHGKERVTLGEAMSHQAGVPGFPDAVDSAIWLDHGAAAAKIAGLEPMWPPGTAHGYHPQTIGIIVNELMIRATGKSIGAHLGSLGADVHCGMSEELAARTGPMVKPPSAPDFTPINDYRRAAFLQRWSAPGGVDRLEWLAAELPASNMHATAIGCAEVMQIWATGQFRGRSFVPDAVRERAMAEAVRGDDLVLPYDLSWGYGVMRNISGHLGPSDTAIGHYGFGGSFVLADPAKRLSIAYTPNRMLPILVGGDRATHLIDEIYRAL